MRISQEAIDKIDAIGLIMAQNGTKRITVRNYTIPEKKAFLGKIEAPEKEGVFIKGMDDVQVKALMQRDRFDEGLTKRFDEMQKKADEAAKRAQDAAERLKNEAKDKANQIISQGQQEANLRLQQAQMQIEEANRILAQKENLQKELASLNRKKQELAPEVNKLQRTYRAYNEGWTDPQGNIHQSLGAIKEEYRNTSEKLSEARIELDKKLEGLSYEMLSDSLVKNLVQEASMQTCLPEVAVKPLALAMGI